MSRDRPIASKLRDFPNPGLGQEENARIIYPLDDADRVEVGGSYIEQMARAIVDMSFNQKELLTEIKLLNARFEDVYQTGLEHRDIERM